MSLIITAALEPDAQKFFDDLRVRHFPPHRNVLQAHVTLFHALTEDSEAEAREQFHQIRSLFPMTVRVIGLKLLGGGVAYELESAPLINERRRFAEMWIESLGRQDRSKNEIHVTVQNKVPAGTARALYEDLWESFEPWATTCIGLDLWRYLDGPWEHLASTRD